MQRWDKIICVFCHCTTEIKVINGDGKQLLPVSLA